MPDRYLYLLTDQLQIVAIMNIAILMDQVKMHPDRYEHQLALNQAAIRYSDLAGRIRDRFLWYRMGQIAEGRGIIARRKSKSERLSTARPKKACALSHMTTSGTGRTTRTTIRSDFLNFLTTDGSWLMPRIQNITRRNWKPKQGRGVRRAAKQEVYTGGMST